MPTTFIEFKIVTPGAQLPSFAHETDSGMDIRARQNSNPLPILVDPGETATIPTGIAAAIPEGFELQVRPRSSMSRRGLLVHFGTVDQGYTGEIKICLTNLSKECEVIEDGEKIAQLVLAPVAHPAIVEVFNLPQTDRGANGFGSTGRV